MRIHYFILLPVILAAGCLSKEEIRRIESRPEGTGVMLSRLPEMIKILATYDATPVQRDDAKKTAERIQKKLSEVTPKQVEIPHYVAVPVPPDERKQGAEQLMIWDTKSSDFIDNSVYDVADPPKEGVEMKWETSSASLAVVYLGKDWGS